MKKHLFKRFLYINYKRFHNTKTWREEHITKYGYTLIIFLFISILMGLDITRSSTYHIFSILFSIFIISIISLKLSSKYHLKIKRNLPKYGTVDKPLKYDLIIENIRNKKEFSIFYKDGFEDNIPSIKEFMTISEPGENKRNIWDRNLLYYRWLWLLKKKLAVKTKAIELPIIPAKKEITQKIELLPIKRGILKFKLSVISQPDIFSMFRKVTHIYKKEELLILPKRYRVITPNLNSNNLNNGSNSEFLSITGKGSEFFALRDYRAGDSIKDIHWKSWAKRGKPIVKEYQERNYFKKAIILDPESDNEEIFDISVSIAASYILPLDNKISNIDKLIVGNYSKKILNNQDKLVKYLAKLRMNTNNFNLENLKQELKMITGVIIILNNLDNNKILLLQYLNKLKIKSHIILLKNNNLHTNIIKKYNIITINVNNLKKELKKLCI